MILITGATGTNGQEITRRLLAAGQSVRVLVRSADKAQGLGKVDVAIGDLSKPDTLGPALQGVTRVLLLTPVHVDAVQWIKNFLKVAQNLHVVKFSGMGAGTPEGGDIMIGHGETDRLVRESGLPYTLLQPNSFYQNMLWSAGSIKGQNTFYLPLNDKGQSMVDVRDIADVAVKVLTGSGHEGKTYVVTGPQALTGQDIANTLSTVLGRTITYVNVPPAAVEDSLRKSGAPEWNAREVAKLMAWFGTGQAAQVTDTVQKLTGHAPRTFEQFVRDHAAAFGAAPVTA